jgi:hypothetical protein
MSGHFSQSLYRRRHILFSSDDNIPGFDDLPPSDPPEDIETDDEPIHFGITQENPFLTYEDEETSTFQDLPIASSDDLLIQNDEWATSDDIPLASTLRVRSQIHNHHNEATIPTATFNNSPVQNNGWATSDDTPLASRLPIQSRTHNHHGHIRSSSLPTPVQVPSTDDIILTPGTERRYRMDLMTSRRLQTMAQNKLNRSVKVEEQTAREEREKEIFFDEILVSLFRKGITLTEFLKYVFNPNTQHIFDWRWRGFFQQRETVKEILGYWTTPGYNQTTNSFIIDWVIEQARRVIGRESKAISESKILQKTSMVVDENFLLDYSLETITDKLHKIAPNSFALFDAFSTTQRQKKELKQKSRKKKELVNSTSVMLLQVKDTYIDLSGSRLSHSQAVEDKKSVQQLHTGCHWDILDCNWCSKTTFHCILCARYQHVI